MILLFLSRNNYVVRVYRRNATRNYSNLNKNIRVIEGSWSRWKLVITSSLTWGSRKISKYEHLRALISRARMYCTQPISSTAIALRRVQTAPIGARGKCLRAIIAKSRPFHLVHLHNRAARVREHDVREIRTLKGVARKKIIRVVRFFRGIRDSLLVATLDMLCILISSRNMQI